jgi:hypothetical protein
MVHYSESSAAFAHPLRKAILISYLPAFILCIVGSAVSNHVLPGLALLPFSASALISVITLALARKQRKKRIQLPSDDGNEEDGDKAPALLSPLAIFFYDVLLATLLMVVLLFIWDKRSRDRGYVRVDTYATVPLLLGQSVTHFTSV